MPINKHTDETEKIMGRVKDTRKKILSELHIAARKWTINDSVDLAMYAAEQVVGIFEAHNPSDHRPREAITAAKQRACSAAIIVGAIDAAVDVASKQRLCGTPLSYPDSTYGATYAGASGAGATNVVAGAYAAAYAAAHAAAAAAHAAGTAHAAAAAAHAAGKADVNEAAETALDHTEAALSHAAYAAAYATYADTGARGKINEWIKERMLGVLDAPKT